MNCCCVVAVAAYALFAVLIIAGLMLVAGCVSNVQYRTSSAPFTGATNQAATDPHNHAIIEKTPDYTLGFVEFDEEGQFWSPKQVETVEETVRAEANVGGTNNPAGIILLVFVHGWKNNAAYNCGNVATFRTALTQLNQAELELSKTKGRPARKMVGVYCGWRGLSQKWEPFKELSFWSRKGTAHKVGGYGAMTQLFVELQKIEELSNATIARDGAPTALIFVGHSFGGAAVYSAVSEFVTKQFVENFKDLKPGDSPKPLKPLGDQVILLNPAFEASRHFNLDRLATTLEKYPLDQRPVLSIFQSEGDWATHDFLPIGRFFPTMFEKFRNAEQRRAARDAVGWFKPFVTHTLEYRTNVAPTATLDVTTGKRQFHSPDKLHQSIVNIEVQRAKWIPNNATPQTYDFDDCRLVPRKKFRPGDPFLVVAVDKQIMKNHDDIDNIKLINFLREYIQFCRDGTTNSSAAK